MATAIAKEPNSVEVNTPEFIRRINDDYKSKISHTFILFGNINDFSDNSGKRHVILKSLAQVFDDNIKGELVQSNDKLTAPINKNSSKGAIRIFASYNLSSGLEFVHETSKKQWLEALSGHYGKEVWDDIREDWKEAKPSSLDSMFGL
jgi:hypothetical protein